MSVFNGKWRIDIGRSKKWDSEAGIYVSDDVGEEIITLRIEDGVQDYEVLYGNDPVIRMGYTSRYDDREWVPYAVREIITRPNQDKAKAVAEFRDRIGAKAQTLGIFRWGSPTRSCERFMLTSGHITESVKPKTEPRRTSCFAEWPKTASPTLPPF